MYLNDIGKGVEIGMVFGWEFIVQQVLVVINGFVCMLFFELEVEFVCNQVLIICLIVGLLIWGCFYYDWGYVYFCNVGNCLLFGGGCNLDFVGE